MLFGIGFKHLKDQTQSVELESRKKPHIFFPQLWIPTLLNIQKRPFFENLKSTKKAPKTFFIENLNVFKYKRLIELLYCEK